MRNHYGRGSQFHVDLLDRSQNDPSGVKIERTSGLVTQKDFGSLDDCSRDRNALLLASGQFRGKTIQLVGQTDKRNRLFRWHGIVGNLHHQHDALANRKAGNQIIELENEPNMLAPDAGQLRFAGTGQCMVPPEHLARCRRVETSEYIE